MRVIDRDLIRGGHYGQRSCEPRKQAEHMAATDPGCYVKILLANSEPSTHGTRRTWRSCSTMSLFRGADMMRTTEALQEFLGTLVIVVTSEGLVRVRDRESSGAGGDCESDSNKY